MKLLLLAPPVAVVTRVSRLGVTELRARPRSAAPAREVRLRSYQELKLGLPECKTTSAAARLTVHWDETAPVGPPPNLAAVPPLHPELP